MKHLSYKIFILVFIIVTILFFLPHEEKRTFDDIKLNYYDRFKVVKFGKYEQDGNIDNGKEDIEWFILDEKDKYTLLITKKTIISIPYHDTSIDMTWEHSFIRAYLNTPFLADNFTKEELSQINVNKTKNGGKNTFDKNSGNNTVDKVFILSNEELDYYFKNNTERIAKGTKYGKGLGLSLVSTMPTAEIPYEDATYYWTRTVGYHQSDAACVNPDGHINVYGFDVRTDGVGARPCMWVRKDYLWKK